jgi:hypothetical protein
MLANRRKPGKPAGFEENRQTTGFYRTVWFNAGSGNTLHLTYFSVKKEGQFRNSSSYRVFSRSIDSIESIPPSQFRAATTKTREERDGRGGAMVVA